MKASVKNYRQAPRKVRLIANLVRGKKVSHALDILAHIQKRAARPFAKLIEGAVANAKEQGETSEDFVIDKVQVDKGFTFKRYRPRARGRASKIDKHTSHIKLELRK
jgi:large subunit ribosomal protein L22